MSRDFHFEKSVEHLETAQKNYDTLIWEGTRAALKENYNDCSTQRSRHLQEQSSNVDQDGNAELMT